MGSFDRSGTSEGVANGPLKGKTRQISGLAVIRPRPNAPPKRCHAERSEASAVAVRYVRVGGYSTAITAPGRSTKTIGVSVQVVDDGLKPIESSKQIAVWAYYGASVTCPKNVFFPVDLRSYIEIKNLDTEKREKAGRISDRILRTI